MTGSPVWFWIGLACVAAGVVVLVLAFIGGRGSAPTHVRTDRNGPATFHP